MNSLISGAEVLSGIDCQLGSGLVRTSLLALVLIGVEISEISTSATKGYPELPATLRTIATMPALIASGSFGHAETIAASSGVDWTSNPKPDPKGPMP